MYRTVIYGNPWMAVPFTQRPTVAKLAARALIAFECSFPLVLILPDHYSLLLLALGISFHLTAAVLMGLNTFFWAFVATYPAVMFCSSVIRHLARN